MTEVDIQQAAVFQRRRSAARKSANLKRLEKARLDFHKMVKLIAEKYRPKRIYQWGSVLDEQRFSEISDIDIAVEGVRSAAEFFAILGDVMEMTDFAVDLVELEKIEPLHAESIRRRGRLVYERPE